MSFAGIGAVALDNIRAEERIRQESRIRDNFERLYAPLVDAWALYDNSGIEPQLLDWSEKP